MAGKRKWSAEEENFIIEQYHLGKTHAEVKRAMRLKFKQSRKLASTHPPHLYDVVKRLKKTVCITFFILSYDIWGFLILTFHIFSFIN